MKELLNNGMYIASCTFSERKSNSKNSEQSKKESEVNT